jgi:hypothetical protein
MLSKNLNPVDWLTLCRTFSRGSLIFKKFSAFGNEKFTCGVYKNPPFFKS